jgi:TolB-like protein
MYQPVYKYFLLVLLCGFSLNLYAARPTIAVLDFNTDGNKITFSHRFVIVQPVEATTKVLSNDLVTHLVKTNKFTVVERSRMDNILKEQEFSESGFISPETAVKMGELIGADYFVMGRIESLQAALENKKVPYTNTFQEEYEGKMIVNVRIVDSRGGKIVAANKFTIDHTDRSKMNNKITPDTFLEALKEKAAQEIVNRIIEGVFPLKIIKITGDTVYINRGEGATFVVGTTLSVISQGEGLVDPDTGESLGASEEQVGTVEISDIQKKFSKAKIITGGKQIKKGAIARIMASEEKQPPMRELTPGSSDKPVSW